MGSGGGRPPAPLSALSPRQGAGHRHPRTTPPGARDPEGPTWPRARRRGLDDGGSHRPDPGSQHCLLHPPRTWPCRAPRSLRWHQASDSVHASHSGIWTLALLRGRPERAGPREGGDKGVPGAVPRHARAVWMRRGFGFHEAAMEPCTLATFQMRLGESPLQRASRSQK